MRAWGKISKSALNEIFQQSCVHGLTSYILYLRVHVNDLITWTWTVGISRQKYSLWKWFQHQNAFRVCDLVFGMFRFLSLIARNKRTRTQMLPLNGIFYISWNVPRRHMWWYFEIGGWPGFIRTFFATATSSSSLFFSYQFQLALMRDLTRFICTLCSVIVQRKSQTEVNI